MIGMSFGNAIVLAVTLAIAFGIGFFYMTRDEHKKAISSYERQWYCLSCGNIFTR